MSLCSGRAKSCFGKRDQLLQHHVRWHFILRLTEQIRDAPVARTSVSHRPVEVVKSPIELAIPQMCRVLRVARFLRMATRVCLRSRKGRRAIDQSDTRLIHGEPRGLWRTARVRRFARSWRKLRSASCRTPHAPAQDQSRTWLQGATRDRRSTFHHCA